ncbi:transcriptional regulatory protein LevR/transcriptional regulator with AAA-type ATPase domain [Clostridium saccharoperbutylacetonicum]|nr:transcriptional regulatory protein LevR/transcriptional regulator with AAA-type ATPase domain [Clostridium saccharoperbutylacetonicum]NSB23400.1 transcriptional regulatory protein LevR/transcriptional regulator with AAA-type ATPase domain [Clostridium saccharoperbutylacetonicum]NSB42770.1 transcriptional regulatory protein LevR/transcriptional regulator with AAA-type ATPase domain [Clostridium saccharoperbutylacetonicum]
MMKRIDLILMKLKEKKDLDSSGISASEIAEELNISRANASNDLNKLVSEGKAIKSKGKPTLFMAVDEENVPPDISVINKFSEVNPSLYSAVEQAKAAILYPPNGMNILLLGETGVGKSTFAGLIYKYAIEMKVKSEESPFITFNCADYANNPQLLLGQLFGVKKGAYTGADFDKVGLIEKADGGILFLDEVHRLPAEGQEMFFTFMDRGVYRRLGETDSERSANVLIITATTEDPNAALLKTFTRRIPMVITIPALRNRGMEERFNLIKQFLLEESGRLGRSITVSINSIKAFLSYNCENNIGQLKSDIQLACAKAYADFLSNKKDAIKINSLDLPSYIREGLYKEVEHRQLWNKLIDINKRYFIFDKDEDREIFEENATDDNIYEMLDLRTNELKARGIKGVKLEEEIERDIEDYFKKYISKVDMSNIKNIIEKDVMNVIEEVIHFCEEELEINLDKKINYGLAVHISNSIDRIRRNKKIVNPKLSSIREEHRKEFNVAVDALKIIDRAIDVNMPIDEAGFIAMFLSYNYGSLKYKQNDVLVIVIAHGVSTATSMADAVNSLLGTKNVVGINAPIEEKPENILGKTIDYIKKNEIKSDILFLVDMGSLTTFGQEIENTFNIKTRTIPLVSTLHALEATRKSMMGYSLDEIYRETLEVNSLYEENALEHKQEKEEKRLAIVTVCTTGEGGAKTLKKLLERNLTFDKKLLDIVPINLVGKESIYERIEKLSIKYEIICFVSPFELEVQSPQFMLDQIIDGQSTSGMQKIIDVEETYLKMEDTLENTLENSDGRTVLKHIKKFIKNIEEELKTNISTNILIGITLHIAAMIDMSIEKKTIIEFEGKDKYIKDNLNLYKIVKNAFMPINTKYSINASEEEICCLMNFFNPRI